MSPQILTQGEKEKNVIRGRLKRIGLIRLLEEVSEICNVEAERIRLTWGDPEFAKVWSRRGELLWTTAQNLRKEEKKVKRRKPLDHPQIAF